jgi:hypothetical protein
MGEVTLEFLARQNEKILSELKDLRTEMSDVRTLTLQGVDFSRRLERRLTEQTNDLELMLKAELIGRLTHFETRIGTTLEALDDRLTDIEGHFPPTQGGSVPS